MFDPQTQQWILQYSNQYGVDPQLVTAMSMQESGGRQTRNGGQVITSPAGAIGAMQLMPATARGLGVDPYDPEQNVMGGVKYIAQMSQRYGGDPQKVMAAYNAGPGRVPVQGPLNLSRLPGETQNYVRSVSANMGNTTMAQPQDFANPQEAAQYLAQTPDVMQPTPMFDPQQPAPAQLPNTAPGGGSLHDRWTQFLSNDDNRAALFQLGISLLQPIAPGQSAAGQIGQALGQAGEVYGTREAMRAQQEDRGRDAFNTERNFGLAQQKLGLERQQTAAQAQYYRDRGNVALLKATGAGGGLAGISPYQMGQLRARLAPAYESAKESASLTGQPFNMTFEQYVQQVLGGGTMDTSGNPQPGSVSDPSVWRSSSYYNQAKQQYAQASQAGNAQLANQVRQDILSKAAKAGVDLSGDFPELPAAPPKVSSKPKPAPTVKSNVTPGPMGAPIPGTLSSPVTIPSWLYGGKNPWMGGY